MGLLVKKQSVVKKKRKVKRKRKVIAAPFVLGKEELAKAETRMKSINVPVNYPLRPEKLKNLSGKKSIHWIKVNLFSYELTQLFRQLRNRKRPFIKQRTGTID